MHGRALDGDVAARHRRRAAVVELHDDTALEHDAVVEALRAVHQPRVAGCEVDEAAHRPVRLHEAEFAARRRGLGELDVALVVEVDGHARRRVHERVRCLVLRVHGRGVGVRAVQRGLAGGGVGGYVDRWGV